MANSCLTLDDLEAMDNEARARLINCLPGYKSAMLVGTCDAEQINQPGYHQLALPSRFTATLIGDDSATRYRPQ